MFEKLRLHLFNYPFGVTVHVWRVKDDQILIHLHYQRVVDRALRLPHPRRPLDEFQRDARWIVRQVLHVIIGADELTA